MKEIKEKEIERYFDTYIWDGDKGGFIYHDLRQAIDQGLNFLSAMSLMVYTEFLGSLMPLTSGLNSKTGNKKRFDNFLFRMGFWFRELDKLFAQEQGKDIFEVFRNGLVHEYFIKRDLRIGKVPSVIARDTFLQSGGEGYGLGSTSDGRLLFATRTYFRDFMKVVKEMRLMVIERKEVLWVKAFCKSARL